MMKVFAILSLLFLVGCQTIKVETVNHFETINLPSSLYTCESLLKKDIPEGTIKNTDVHSVLEKFFTKNSSCRANMNAIKKIITDYNAKAEELNKKK